MIVRLKVCGGSRKRSPFFWFQFYDSPIKSKSAIKGELRLDGFNSMIVRLKAFLGRWYQCIPYEFQFYDSPIKSDNIHHSHSGSDGVSIL